MRSSLKKTLWIKAAALLLAALAALCLSACKKLDESIEDLADDGNPYREYYEKGVEAYENADYYAAREYFLTAEEYGNSKDYLEAIDEYERLYLDGVAKLEAKDYIGARSTFEAVSDFSNASEYIAYIDELKGFYDEGMRLYGEQDFVAAREQFVRSCDYLNADDYIKSIDDMEQKYQYANQLYIEGKLEAAIQAFEAIGANYKDTYDILSAIYGELEHGGAALTDYLYAYLKSHEDEGAPVQYELTDVNESSFMITDSQGLLMIGDIDDFGSITEVSFWVGEELAAELTEEQINAMLAHCIRALDIEMMSYADVVSNIKVYTNGEATYGNYAFELIYDDSGYAVLKAKYIES